MSDITPSSQSLMLPKSVSNPIADFGDQPILGALWAGDDPIQGGVINLMGVVAVVAAATTISTSVIPLVIGSGFGLMLLVNDYVLQCKRIRDPNYDANAIDVKAQPVAETPVAAPVAAPIQSTPIVETPTPVPQTPAPVAPVPPVPLVETVVTSSEWDVEEQMQEQVAASLSTVPDLVVPLSPEQIKATEFAALYLINERVWTADQLAIEHFMTVEQWINALAWVAATLPQDYLWTLHLKVLFKLK